VTSSLKGLAPNWLPEHIFPEFSEGGLVASHAYYHSCAEGQVVSIGWNASSYLELCLDEPLAAVGRRQAGSSLMITTKAIIFYNEEFIDAGCNLQVTATSP